jgi:death-on-curing family protein
LPTYKLTSKLVEIIHDLLVVELWPSDEPVFPSEYRNQPLIDSAVNRPFQTAYQEQIHPTVVDKGVALFHSLIANHPFANGNKRTAVMALNLFFSANEHCLFMDQFATISIARQIARYKEQNKTQDQALNEARNPIAEATASFQEMKSVGEESGNEDVKKVLGQAERIRAALLAGDQGVVFVTEEE